MTTITTTITTNDIYNEDDDVNYDDYDGYEYNDDVYDDNDVDFNNERRLRQWRL